MEWRQSAVILDCRPYGETSTIAHVLTRDHGRYAGLVRGGRGKRLRGILQPGNEIDATWRARLADQLGNLSIEPVKDRAARHLSDQVRLAGLTAVCALVQQTMPEREAHPAIYDALSAVLDSMDETPLWPIGLVQFELGLLQELGYGLDLSACAVTGVVDGLTHVSPNTGRAVSTEVAAPYKGRLLPLPQFLNNRAHIPDYEELLSGFRLTGHFLNAHVLGPADKHLPKARDRMLDRLAQADWDKESA